MTDAVPFDMGLGKAFEVEHCKCPTGYSGLSCEVRYIFFSVSHHISNCGVVLDNSEVKQTFLGTVGRCIAS